MRAKFKLQSIQRQMGMAPVVGERETRWQPTEIWSLILVPVCGNGDRSDENTKFWQATPSGEIRLQCVNKAAVESMELDREYYVDFTPVKP